MQHFENAKVSKGEADVEFTWNEKEISLLINIWADERIYQALDTGTRKRSKFDNITKQLEESDFTCSCNEI